MTVRSSDLDPDQLVDGLVEDIDDLRELANEFGTRPYRLYGVTRTWLGGEVGVGEYSDALEEFTPRPKVEPFQINNRLEPCGLDEAGFVKLTEVSLANDYHDLKGSGLTPGSERIFMLREGYGQHQPDRYFTIDRPPFPDRENDFGWIVWLRRIR